jgi:hypothetical protein
MFGAHEIRGAAREARPVDEEATNDDSRGDVLAGAMTLQLIDDSPSFAIASSMSRFHTE